MHKFIVTAAKGLDELVKQEIATLLNVSNIDEFVKVQPGQVSFSSSLKDAYKICMGSRLANRVLLVLNEGKATSADTLYETAAQVDWPQIFNASHSFSVVFNGTSKALNNSQFGALKIKDAIVDSFVEDGQNRPNVDRQAPNIQFHARLKRETVLICLDLSYKSLHQRGYRLETGEAPLKEQLAAAILFRSQYHQNLHLPFLDPMCGSGTIAIEATLMAANIPPNLNREYWGFEAWHGHNQAAFDEARGELFSLQTEPKAKIYAFDISTKMIDIAKQNAAKAGVAEFIEFKQCDALSAKIEHPSGIIVSNPPYGERLDDYVALLPFYNQFGLHLKQNFADWYVSLLCSNDQLLKALKLRTHKKFKFFNGKLETQLACYQLDDSNCAIFESRPSDDEFSNRLKKNLKKLQAWVKKNDTNAYRVYDADLPNYNFAIDRYADYVIVQEYAPPKQIPEAKAQERLAQALLHIPIIMNVDKRNIALKVRQRQQGLKQYEKVDSQSTRIQVYENGAKFYINPNDYLDVGLFLDHRLTRQHFAQASVGKHVLNLFCYTGSVSVHAALAGAKSVTSVDMSNTYLNWARDNFALNKLAGKYEFIQADCLQYFNKTKANQQYDRIFLDPPSFSNSKRMEHDWDVQRDYLTLINQAKQHLSKEGMIYFSNNLRSFKIDIEALERMGFAVKDISAMTIDEDFKRNTKIHRCWILSL